MSTNSQSRNCDRPDCTIAGLHDHVDAVIKIEPASKPEVESQEHWTTTGAGTSRTATRAPEPPAPEPASAPEPAPEQTGIMGLLGDALDEIAGVTESFTGKPSSLRESATKVRKVGVAGHKVQKLGEAIQNSKIPALGKKIVQTVKDNARMREYHK